MQLKLKRSQRDSGVISSSVIFCLDARAEYTPSELADIRRYKLHNQVIYNSEASKRLLDKGDAASNGSTRGALKQLAFTALAAMRLNITIASLEKGQHIECKSMDELLAAESALMDACETLTGYLNAAATFDGREVVIDFTSDTPHLAASATPPQQRLVAPLPPAPPSPLEALPPPSSAVIEEAIEPPETSASDFDWESQPSAFDSLKAAWNDDTGRPLILGGLGVVLLVLLLATCS